MFTFPKTTTTPGSKLPSTDSLALESSATTSISDKRPPYAADALSYAESLSAEEHFRLHGVKRGSIFNLRSRSNTATSTSSPLARPVTMADATMRPLSQDLHLRMGQTDSPSNKHSLFRSRRGKASSGTLLSMSLNDLHMNKADDKRTSVLRRYRRSTTQPDETAVQREKPRISSPFDFKHLTHTDRHQFASISKTSETDLATAFQAVSTSQVPRRGLTGIQANDLHPSSPRSPSAAGGPSRLAQMEFVNEQPQIGRPTTILPAPPLRTSRSVESFSQPSVSRRMHRHTQSVVSTSSAEALHSQPVPNQATHHILPPSLIAPISTTKPEVRQSGLWESQVPNSPTRSTWQLSTLPEDDHVVGHALTTPDNLAVHTTTPPFSPGLEDVAEEPERFISPRAAPLPPRKNMKYDAGAVLQSNSVNSSRSTVVKLPTRRSSITSTASFSQRMAMSRPASQLSDTLPSVQSPQAQPNDVLKSVRRISNTWHVIETSWEDDIDYIYDNALEADCEFEWDRRSEHGDASSQDCAGVLNDVHPSAPTSQSISIAHHRMSSSAIRPFLVLSCVDSAAEPGLPSADSTSTFDASIRTPSDPVQSPAPHLSIEDSEGLVSMSTHGYKEDTIRHGIYGDLLAHYGVSERQFAMFEPIHSATNSLRSSHVRSSKGSSFDSSTISSGQRSTSWGSGLRRSASSAGSLPDLIHSSRSTRRGNDVVVEHPSEHVAAEEMDNTEDDETTPPARRPASRTFFNAATRPAMAEADSKQTVDDVPDESIPAHETKVSHHKYAASDGAAKMLNFAARPDARNETLKTRSRAASSSSGNQSSRGQYLKLFPQPPHGSNFTFPSR